MQVWSPGETLDNAIQGKTLLLQTPCTINGELYQH